MIWLNTLFNRPPQGEIAEDWTYTDFCAATQTLAHTLRDETSVALWFDDAALFASALLAAWQAGCRVYLPPADNAENRAWANAQNALWLTDRHDFDEKRHRRYDGQAQSHPAAPFAIADSAEVFLKTSGTSGSAKIIRKTAAQMQAEAHALAAILPWRGITAYASVSAQHLYGLTFRIFTALRCGWRIGRAQLRYPEHLLNAARTPCIWITSPALLTRLHDKSGWEQCRIHGILSAGGALPAATGESLARTLGFYPTDIYGSTETGVIAKRQGQQDWQLLPGVQAGTDADGTLWAQSPWTDGREQTADLAVINGDTLQLHGRADRIVKFEDKRISLTRLEHDLLAHPAVLDAHCARHPQHGRIAAWLALSADGIAYLRRDGRAALIDHLKQHLRQSQDIIALPRSVRLAAQLPRDSQAKIRREDFVSAFTRPCDTPDWQIVEETAQYAHFRGTVPLDLPYFAGHFADFPLLPGVVEVQWAMQLAARYPWGRGTPLRLENLKYQQFVRPHDTVDISLRWDADKGKVHFTLRHLGGDKLCASGRMVLA